MQALGAAVAQAKALNKAIYVFSVAEAEDDTPARLLHLNYLPKEEIKDGFNAKVWSGCITEIVGGKVS